MSFEQNRARVHLERREKFQFTASFPDTPQVAPMQLDEQPPLGDGTGPNPASLLAAALGNCLTSSLIFCLNKVRVEPSNVVTDVTARIVRNERGRFRIGDVEVDISLQVNPEDAAGLERCEGLFDDFCIVTESVRHGIPVNVRIAAGQPNQLVSPASQA